MQCSKAIAWRPRRAAAIGVTAVAAVALLALACGSGPDDSVVPAEPEVAVAQEPAPADAVEQAAGEAESPPEDEAASEAPEQAAAPADPPPADEEAAQASEQSAEPAAAPPAGDPFLPLDAAVTPFGEPILRDLGAPRHFGSGWGTNFDISLVDYREILSGGVPRDGIPPIREPRFISIAEADARYVDGSPVLQFTINGDARAYPLEILIWHEIVIDVVGGVPVAVTYCPLCNTAITFDRTIGGTTYDFGVSGLLRNSDLIMYDRQTESLWQQIGGVAIVGDMVGARLTVLPSTIGRLGRLQGAVPGGHRALARDRLRAGLRPQSLRRLRRPRQRPVPLPRRDRSPSQRHGARRHARPPGRRGGLPLRAARRAGRRRGRPRRPADRRLLDAGGRAPPWTVPASSSRARSAPRASSSAPSTDARSTSGPTPATPPPSSTSRRSRSGTSSAPPSRGPWRGRNSRPSCTPTISGSPGRPSSRTRSSSTADGGGTRGVATGPRRLSPARGKPAAGRCRDAGGYAPRCRSSDAGCPASAPPRARPPR